jgi:bacillithiol biosynthesis cysteine-adding enzyme BshC
MFIPYIKNELTDQTIHHKVSETIVDIAKDYKIQVNPREINLFYLSDGSRERIIHENGNYKTVDNKFSWNKIDLLKHVDEFPDRFSPNVIMRPLYQEVILPNLCYIGGGGEIAYWLELKSYFDELAIPFPILLLRNSVLIISKKQKSKLEKLSIPIEDLFLKTDELIRKKVKESSKIKIDFSEQRNTLIDQFAKLEEVAELTDKSFISAVKAQRAKQINGLNNLEKKLLRAEKRKHAGLVSRITAIQEELFPKKNLEERTRNFSEPYLDYGDELIGKLVKALDPLDPEFTILTI